ncbi:hypothetical protein E1202_07735 [Saccharopolyspora karakumensis]|uniref:DDE Tnp4 domain-containing protein n=1 Tax=Saccharopolyspora karakumensis TaxID=2530386 RepID=A0A4R5BY59_9PSEU|nr:hypothetical protein E1202_07735 [Saccharopolyspora karakumensis]
MLAAKGSRSLACDRGRRADPHRPDRHPGPTRGVGLWWSGKHRHHDGNIQVVSAPGGWPLWISDVRPGREHNKSATRADPELLARIVPQP